MRGSAQDRLVCSGLVLQAGAGQLSQTKDNFTTTCNNFLRAENDGCALHVGFD